MKQHHYRVTVQALPTRAGISPSSVLAFEVAHHDELFGVAERVRRSAILAPEASAALAVGLKLFTGVMLQYRKDSLFADLEPAMRTFIGNLKARTDAAAVPASHPEGSFDPVSPSEPAA